MRKDRPQTPDGRYFVARGVLRRCTNPNLADSERRALIKALMQARMGLQSTDDVAITRARIDEVKRALGEAGPVWWFDGAPDLSGKAPAQTIYADWWHSLSDDEQLSGTFDPRDRPPPE